MQHDSFFNILIVATSIELFADEGLTTMTSIFFPASLMCAGCLNVRFCISAQTSTFRAGMDLFNDDNFITKKIDKGTTLLSKGSVCKSAYKVVRGCLKSFVIDKAGKEHVIQFAPEEWLITDMDSFLNNKPSHVFITALEKSEVLVLDRTAFADRENLEKSFLIEQNTRLLRSLISMNRRLINMLSSTAEERYLGFIETYPTLLQRLPLKLIAAYIGITPEYLSDIRRKLAKK